MRAKTLAWVAALCWSMPALAQQDPAQAPKPDAESALGADQAATKAEPADAEPSERDASAPLPTPSPSEPAGTSSGPSEPPPQVTWANPQDAQASTAAEPPPAHQPIDEPLPPPSYSHPARDPISSVAAFFNTAAPLGDTRDFVGGFGWWGFSFDFRQRIVERTALGLWPGTNSTTRRVAPPRWVR